MDNKDWKREMRDIENEASQPRRYRDDASQRKYNPSYKPNFENIPPPPYEPPPVFNPESKNGTNFGWLAFLLLIASITFGFVSFGILTAAVGDVFSPDSSPIVDPLIGVALMILSFTGFITSIALAGAGIAVKRGVIPAYLVIAFFIIPPIYLVAEILLGVPNLSGSLPTNDFGSGVSGKWNGQ